MTGDQKPSASRGASSVTLIGRLGFRGRHATPEERAAILDQFFFEGDRRLPYLQRFVILMALAAVVAAGGLANNSAAVVIGAMLIAPLMTPILGTAAALVVGRPQRVVESLVNSLGGAALAILVGFIVALFQPQLSTGAPLPDELLARTQPNLTDLLIALAAGAAGAFVAIRSEAGSALPGVGIAVALVPPLTTVGMTIALGKWGLALNAGLLFATNLLAIIAAGGIVLVLAGYEAFLGRLGERRAKRAWTLLAVAIVVVAIPLGWQTSREVDQGRTATATIQAVAAWAPDMTLTDLTVDETVEPTLISVDLIGRELPDDVDELAGMLAAELGRAIDVQVIFRPMARVSAPAP